MAKANDTEPTLFQRLAQLRASAARLLVDTQLLHDAIWVPAEEGNARQQAIDLRLQLARAASTVAELADDPYGPYAPEPEHIDQVLSPSAEVSHG